MIERPQSVEKLGSNNELEKHSEIQVKIQPKEQKSWCPVCSMDYYRQFFNIEQRDVQMRVRCALFPKKTEFFQCVGKNPDLWGPFWIPSTIIFILFAGGNLSNLIMSSDRDNFTYEYSFIYVAILLVYGISFIIPMILAAILKFGMKSELRLFDVVCLYGYSMTVYVPVLMLCTIPYNSAQWVLLMYGLLISTLFLMINLWDELKKSKRSMMLVIPMIGCNLIVLVIFKLYFFGQIYVEE